MGVSRPWLSWKNSVKLPTLRCYRPSMDAEPTETRLSPVTGEKSSTPQVTELQISYDDTDLIVVFKCVDIDIWGTYTGRDDPLYEEEVVEAFVCPTGDLRHY